MILQRNKTEISFLKWIKNILKLSAVRKVLETRLFLALGSFETLGSKLSHGTSWKFADVRTHLRKVSKLSFSSIWDNSIFKSCLYFYFFRWKNQPTNFLKTWIKMRARTAMMAQRTSVWILKGLMLKNFPRILLETRKAMIFPRRTSLL